jgi:hypothetical protein
MIAKSNRNRHSRLKGTEDVEDEITNIRKPGRIQKTASHSPKEVAQDVKKARGRLISLDQA